MFTYEKYFSRNTTELEKEEYINFVMHRIKEAKNLDRINNESTFNITYLFFFGFILYLFYLFWINRVELLKDFFQSSLKKKKSRCYQVNLLKQLKLKQLKLKQLKLKQLKLKQLKLKQLNTEDNLKK